MATILKVKFEDGTYQYVVKVDNKSIGVLPAITRVFSTMECSAITAGKSMVKHVYASNNINVTVEAVDIHEAFHESMRRNPVFTVPNENSDTAIATGLKPWHHCFTYGDKVFGVIWDTRDIDVIANIKDVNFADCVILKHDQGGKFKLDDKRFDLYMIHDLKTKLPAEITQEQFTQIQWP